ncbi:hypothetical protein Tco_0353164 [Tanacetum coccineum]
MKANTPRSCLRWKPPGRIFNIVSLRWVPTGKIFTSSTIKVDSAPPTSSNKDITNPYECEQTLNIQGFMNLTIDEQKQWRLQDNTSRPLLKKESVSFPVPAVVALEPIDSTSTPSSTSVDQDAPSLSTSQTPQEIQSPKIPSSVEEHFHDIEVAHLDNDPFFGVLIPEPNFEESSSRDVIPTLSQSAA